ncbi:MAG: hydrogenase expression/formation protein HypE [Deltaproteobacteria bacterium]|nr:hydrogenase expression/formation protein HypE [Deltaproteobacteria bacterium]
MSADTQIQLAHGGGGQATSRLVRELFLTHFHNERLALLDDGARLDLSGPLAMSTDAFVVDPLFFPGGDIGKLAVCGTVNDVAMCGARPRSLAAAFVLEEGLPMADLERIVASMAAEIGRAGVELVTGDTKVVPRGHGDGVYIATTGVGEVLPGVEVSGHRARPGDRILLSGPVGDHGAAIMSVRAGIELGGDALRSDCASVAGAAVALCEAVHGVRCLRDPTRGGLAGTLCEIAGASGVGFEIDEARIPVSEPTRAACEILGLDPLALACEGRFVAVVADGDAAQAADVLGARPEVTGLAEIGRAVAEHPGRVVLRTSIGGSRLLDRAEGEPLPRIC